MKWIGVVLAALIGLVVLVIAGLMISTQVRLNKTYTIQPETITIPTDATSVARGRHWVVSHCTGCHGEDLGGGPFFEDAALGYVDATNLTPSEGGIGSTYTDADWVRTLRHGVKPNGRSVFIMPADEFYYLSDADLGAIIAYLKTVPPVDRTIRPRKILPLAKVLYALGAFGSELKAETISHDVRPDAPAVGETTAYGEYLVRTGGCNTCHGAQLSGGKDPDPAAPLAPNLTPGGELAAWSDQDFITAMRTGITPGGRQLSEFMPWKEVGRLTDNELKAIYLYLKAQPALVPAK